MPVYTVCQLRDLIETLPLENINIAPHAAEIRMLSDGDAPWHDLTDERVAHLSHVLAPLTALFTVNAAAECDLSPR